MSQRQQLERILEIDRRIRAGLHPHPKRLAEEWGICTRVLFKDRDFMISRLGAPMVFDKVRRGWTYTDPAWSLPSVLITEGELLALVLGMECAKRYAGTALEGSLRSAVSKVTRSLSGPVSVDLDSLKSGFSVEQPASLGGTEESLKTLLKAIKNKKLVRMRYFTAMRRKESERDVEPVHLFNREGEWYLIAYDRSHREFRYFHTGRIRSLHILGRAFGSRPAFDARTWLARSFQVTDGAEPVAVAVRFDAEQAPYVRDRRWHETQALEELPDGGVTIRFTTAGLIGVRRWVLQYGRHAEVLEPVGLREEIRREAEALEGLYARAKKKPRGGQAPAP